MKKKFAVLGIGKFGFNVAKTLGESKDCEVIAIDNEQDTINIIDPYVTYAYRIDAMDEKALVATGIEDVDTAIVSIGEDVETNLIVVMHLLDLGIKDIIVKSVNPIHRRILEKVGVTRIIDPEKEIAIKVAHILTTANVLSEINLTDDYSIFEVKAPTKITGKNLRSLELRKKYDISVLGIKQGKNINVNPSPESLIHENDILIVLANLNNVSKFTE